MKELAKNKHTTSSLWILLELYLPFLHKPDTFTQPHPWLSNHCSIPTPTPRHDSLTYCSLLIPYLAPTAHAPPSGQISTSSGPHLHPRPTNQKKFSIQSLPMQTTIFSIMNEVNLDVCTNPPTPTTPFIHDGDNLVIISSANFTKKTWSSFPSQLAPGHDLVPCCKHSSPPPTTLVRNPGKPHTRAINITDQMPTSCTNVPPNHYAHLGSSCQPTSDGANLPCPHAEHSLETPTLQPHQVCIHFNASDSASQRRIDRYYVMLPVLGRSRRWPMPMRLLCPNQRHTT